MANANFYEKVTVVDKFECDLHIASATGEKKNKHDYATGLPADVLFFSVSVACGRASQDDLLEQNKGQDPMEHLEAKATA